MSDTLNVHEMLERAIPSSSERLPVIGLGTWRTFDPPRITDAALAPIEQTLASFEQAGGRVIDTSPMYGKAQAVVGRVTAKLGVNRDLFIATKVWTTGRQAGIHQMEESMRLLGRTQIDLMQIHNLVDWRAHLPTLREWKAAGRIRYIGITHYEPSSYNALADVLEQEQIDFVQWAEVLLKFVIAHTAVTCAIPATATPEHMRLNLAAGEGRLPTERERAKLVEYLES